MINLHRVLIVDDSKVIRDGLRQVFMQDERFEVVGEAANGNAALDAVKTLKPDVVTMDISMPEMDGITALKHLMITCPTPTLMLSSLSSEGASITFDALRYGAVDFIQKPSRLEQGCFDKQIDEICSRTEYAASVDVNVIRYISPKRNSAVEIIRQHAVPCKKIVAMGAAEGGYSSLLKIIPHLSVESDAAYLIVLYVDAEYVDLYVEYLNSHSVMEVKVAEHNETIEAGVCYVRSGSDYLSVHKEADDYVLHISPAPFASRKGSIDMLMFSTADVAAGDPLAFYFLDPVLMDLKA